MRLSALSLAITRLGAVPFSPLVLFGSSEPGVFFDASDLATMFQDSAGTTPAALESPVGLWLDKSRGLAIGADLAVNGVFAADTDWTKGAGWSIGSGVATKVAGSASALSQTVASTAGRWYRCSATITRTAGTLTVSLGTSGTTATFTANHTGNFYLFSGTGTQTLSFSGDASFAGTVDNVVVQQISGSHASQSTSGSRPVLSARVNLLTQTEDFSAAAWTKYQTSVSSNAVTAPDGTLTADKLIEAATNDFHYAYPTVTLNSGSTYKLSCYAKAAERSWFWLQLPGAVSPKVGAVFDLQNGVVGNTTGSPSATIAAVGNGWYFCTITGTASSTAATQIQCGTADSNVNIAVTTAYAGDGTSGVYTWGADLRLTADATAAIPAYQRVGAATLGTSGAAGVADYATDGFPVYDSLDGVDDNVVQSASGGATAGFYLCAAVTVRGGAAANRVIWSDTGTNTGYRVRINTSNQLEISAGNGAAYTTIATVATLPVGETHIVTAWDDGTNLNVQIDGGAVASTARPTVSAGTATATIGKDNGAASGYLNGRIHQLIYRTTAPSADQRTQTRNWVAAKAGVVL